MLDEFIARVGEAHSQVRAYRVLDEFIARVGKLIVR